MPPAVSDPQPDWRQLSAAALPVDICRNPRVVPPAVRQFSVVFDPLDVRDTGADWNHLLSPTELADATPARRFEFLAGRACVAEAMRRVGHPGSVLPRRANGAPVWPAGMTGSITHTIGFVSAAVAPTDTAEAIGIDSEEILSAERAGRVATIFASAQEIDTVRAAGLDEQAAITLIFSAKEAVFKCLHAAVRRVFDFHDVRVAALSGERRRFTAQVVQELSAAYPAGTTISGRFDIDSRRVHTGVIVPPRTGE